MVHYSDFVVDSRIQRQARALAERGDRVDCICLNADEEIPVGSGQINLHRAAAAKPRGGARAYLSGNARFLAGAARKVSALDRREPFDLIEIHNMPDALVFAAWRPKLRGVPLVLNFHDTFPELFATVIDLGEADPNVAHSLRNHFQFVESLIRRPNESNEVWFEHVRAGRRWPCRRRAAWGAMIRALVALGRSTSAAAERVEEVEFDAAHCDELRTPRCPCNMNTSFARLASRTLRTISSWD